MFYNFAHFVGLGSCLGLESLYRVILRLGSFSRVGFRGFRVLDHPIKDGLKRGNGGNGGNQAFPRFPPFPRFPRVRPSYIGKLRKPTLENDPNLEMTL